MKSFDLKKLAAVSVLGVVTILGTSEIAKAQGHSRDNHQDEQKHERKAENQHEKTDRNSDIQPDHSVVDQQRQAEFARQQNEHNRIEQQRHAELARQQQHNDRYRVEQQRQAELARQQNERYRIEQQRQAELVRQQNERYRIEQLRQSQRNNQYYRSGNDRSNGNGYYTGNANSNSNRYRVYRNGSYYNTDYRGAELLRQAVNEGYRQGFTAGRSDLDGRRRISYSNSNIYQSGTYGYQSYVNQGQYQYYFRQGFQRGYQDGANSRYRNNNSSYGQYNDGYNDGNGQYDDYNQQYQYGSSNNGVLSILGSILGQILNIRSY
ncbi:MAG: hypothetical protein ABIP78_13690 [Pyrinomonadaceae bacterium]